MKSVTIYTNGEKLFTLENYGKTAGVCHVNGITIHSEVSQIKARQMHSTGSLLYISGTGDRKVLSSGNKLRKNTKVGKFQIN